MNDIEWDAYRVLLAVIERGSFSRGASELAISQPTASRRVDDLERALGTRLLVRRSRGVAPTPAGERVVAELRRMHQAAGAIAQLASADPALPAQRRVRISVTEGLGTFWLPQHVVALRGGDPALAIDLVVDNAAVDLGARAADIAIRLFRPRQPDLVAKKLGALEFGFYAAPAYLARCGTPRRIADLDAHDHVGLVLRGDVTAPAYLRWLRTLVPEDRFVTSASTLTAMIELARAGAGIVLAANALLASDRRLRRLLPRAKPPAMDIWLAVHTDVRRDPDVAKVYERLARILAEISA